MARLTEERITKFLLDYLKSLNFVIFSYDFPQSGTGYSIRPDLEKIGHKNLKNWIPDIIAIKEGTLIFFENKDHNSSTDKRKIKNIVTGDVYKNSISKLMARTKTNKYFIVLGMPLNFFDVNEGLFFGVDGEIGCELLQNEIKIKSVNKDFLQLFDPQ